MVDLAGYFSDPEGDTLDYTAVSVAPAVAAVALSGRMLTVAGVARGETVVTAAATDPWRLAASQSYVDDPPDMRRHEVRIARRCARSGAASV